MKKISKPRRKSYLMEQGVFKGNLFQRGKQIWVGIGIVFLLIFITPYIFNISSEGVFVKVKRVIDGDTILLTNGERVRYIGIDAPETKHPQKEVEYLGKEAYKVNQQLVEGKKVRLEFDVEKRDRYGRLLAYVFIGDIFVQGYLIKQGYALVYTVPPNLKYQKLFLQLQKSARENKRGLWAEDNKKESSSPGKYVASKLREPFHYPWCKGAKKIYPKHKQWFFTREEAIRAGHRPCQVCKP